MTRFCALTLLLALPLPALADRLASFATCTGQLSAFMEHQWLMQDPGADATRIQRDAMAEFLQATGDARKAMGLRVEAKAAMASALQAADLGGHPERKARLLRQIAACLRLLPQV